jgi:hypothetical protein
MWMLTISRKPKIVQVCQGNNSMIFFWTPMKEADKFSG